MSKLKHSPEWMLERVQEYLQGLGSYELIAKNNNISVFNIKKWVRRYLIHGASVFCAKTKNASYSKDFKIKCVELVISGKSTVDDIVAEYNISDSCVLRRWIKKYNSNIELKDYDPKQEVYMASAKRKTTLKERKEIAEYCIEHNNDYKNTAAKFDVSYTQVYSWVRKYNANGEDAILDKRGHHKTDVEVDELEKLRRENVRLKRKLQESDMLVQLLKKVKEFEGM